MAFELLAHNLQNLVRSPGTEVCGQQRVFEFREQIGINLLFARDKVFDLGGDLRPRLRDRLLQPVEQGSALFALVLFFLAEDGKHSGIADLRSESFILAEENGGEFRETTLVVRELPVTPFHGLDNFMKRISASIPLLLHYLQPNRNGLLATPGYSGALNVYDA